MMMNGSAIFLRPVKFVAIMFAIASLTTMIAPSTIAESIATQAGIRSPFPDWESPGRRDRVALFIGINDYPDPETSSLRGCVNDAIRMRELFRDRFGFDRTMLITDDKATRAGIGEAFELFLAQVEKATEASTGRVDALIYFAGHGSQVKDQNDDEDDDDYDETWVSHNSSLGTGANDIRDDELSAVAARVTSLGAQLLIISDSCHSGSIHRGQSLALDRSVKRATDVDGPTDTLVRGLETPASGSGPADGATPAGFGADLSGLDVVMYSACRDFELAWEGLDENGNRSGRFTASMHKVLRDIGRTTYSELHRRVVNEMASRWPDGSQRPQLEFTQGNLDELFLEDGVAPRHARIQAGSLRSQQCMILEGTLHGVQLNATVLFYPTLDALDSDRDNPAAIGVVKSTTPWTATVKLPSDASITETHVARIDQYQSNNFGVWVDPAVSDDVRNTILQEATTNKTWLIARDVDEADVVVAPIPGSTKTGIYRPTAVPRGGIASESQPAPMREMTEATLVTSLTDISRAQRLMGLKYNDGFVYASIVVHRNGEWITMEGVPRLEAGEEFGLKLENLTSRPLYVYILSFDHEHSMAYLFPQAGDHELQLQPNRPVILGEDLPFTVMIDRPHDLGADNAERTYMKIIATAERFDLQSLAGGVRAVTRGTETPFERAITDVFGDAVFGQTRGHPRRSGVPPMSWATNMVTFDAVPASGSSSMP